MSKLYYIHAPMNTGKSTYLLMKAHSFLENNIQVLCIKPSIDDRDGKDIIKSRLGIQMDCLSIDKEDNIKDIIIDYCNRLIAMDMTIPQWILCDESQFLTQKQVDELGWIVDYYNINVMCYGLRNDFTGHLFEGSKRLFEIADNVEEIKLNCECGNKALINARVDSFGNIMLEGDQIQIGGNDMYKPLCRKCFLEKTNCN